MSRSAKASVIHICGTATYKPGDPRPSGYLDFHEWAMVQMKAGLKEMKCSSCGKWKFQHEMSERLEKRTMHDSQWREVEVTLRSCVKCEKGQA